MNFMLLLVGLGVIRQFRAFTREFHTFTREFHTFTREFHTFTREFHAFTREFHAFTREFHTFTREFHAFTREFHAFTREFHTFTREFGAIHKGNPAIGEVSHIYASFLLIDNIKAYLTEIAANDIAYHPFHQDFLGRPYCCL
ncbi:hypothetical protein KEH51_27345 [[Brevibacterium] frigoritolerans]|uniref:Uncharacterized protein n=1 Tax=Peribacillus frigoritolerans TaxID=450367 RepID=A0A941FK64_9BACI|nr:hypothetical protein [Peribacillus frigoritolerans]